MFRKRHQRAQLPVYWCAAVRLPVPPPHHDHRGGHSQTDTHAEVSSHTPIWYIRTGSLFRISCAVSQTRNFLLGPDKTTHFLFRHKTVLIKKNEFSIFIILFLSIKYCTFFFPLGVIVSSSLEIN